jgi:hypothetical protein
VLYIFQFRSVAFPAVLRAECKAVVATESR